MPEALDQQIRARLAQYLAGDISLEDFEGWLTPASWELEEPGAAAAEALASAIMLKLAEFSNGDWTEEELRDALGAFVAPWSRQTDIRTGSYATVTRSALRPGRSGVVGTAREVVYG